MDVAKAASANNTFGLDLYKLLVNGEKAGQNIFLSPFSISVALAMTQLGARENTALEMARSLRWDEKDQENVHKGFQSYMKHLQTPSDKYQLNTANRIYIERSYSVLQEFMTKTKDLYLAEPVNANFKSDFEGERVNINTWVAEKTNDKIQDLITEGVLDSLTRMVLVNAIYFKGQWDNEFEPEDTKPLPFKVSPSNTKQISMMRATEKYAFIEDGDLKCIALALPYKGKELSMVILLPNDDFGLKELESKLTPEKLSTLLKQTAAAHPQKVELTLPKFEMTSSFQMKEVLVSLGMRDAFDMTIANFSGMSEGNDLVLSEVIHKAFVKVNEEGTEAAAATVAVMMPTCLPPSPRPVVTVDHPFLFVIVDNKAQGTVLFIGRVMEPSE